MLNNDPPDYSKLIPELAQWNNGDGISPAGWLCGTGDFQLAIAFTQLFWPDFVEHDGCIFFSTFSPETYRSFMAQCNGDRASVENVMNHHHLLDFFRPASNPPIANADQLLYLGTILQDIWQTKLTRDFPTRSLLVTFEKGTPDNLLDFILSFHQPSNNALP